MTDNSQFTHQPVEDSMSVKATQRIAREFGLGKKPKQATAAPTGTPRTERTKPLPASVAYVALNLRQGPPIA